MATAPQSPDGWSQIPAAGSCRWYILDFVCFESKVIIEVDGGQHSESRRDEVRDGHFKSEGFRILRFWNEEIENSLDFVIRKIVMELQGSTS